MYDIYQFDDQRDKTVIYIGMTNNLARRIRQHLSKDGLLYPLFQELRAEGLELLPSIIASTNYIEEARQIEKEQIQHKKPLLNRIHNQKAIYERQEAKWYAETITDLMENNGLSYREAIFCAENFLVSEGDHYNYKLIKKTAQLVRKMASERPFTESEILDIALQIYRVDRDK